MPDPVDNTDKAARKREKERLRQAEKRRLAKEEEALQQNRIRRRREQTKKHVATHRAHQLSTNDDT